ncbi:MAG: response regulator transcription factor [Sediminibacterium sp.]
MKILLVEDDPDVASLIKKTLDEEAYEVTIAMDGELAWDYINRFNYTLFIFDLMLPGINGIELCKRCRKAEKATPILMLTALSTTDNVVLGLESGADDYLAKPFKIAELLARVKSLIRRSNMLPPATEATPVDTGNKLSYADVVMNLDEKTVTRNEVLVELTATEYRLLEYFLQNPKRVLSRMDILEKVWGYDFNMNTKVVDVYVNYLRKKLDADTNTKLIQTAVGMGYMLKEE